ncbi:MAG: hypothetical protein RQ715_01060 [Methylococcales bacterium]|nr:hypothetical protein [Methylococcales bacterium]
MSEFTWESFFLLLIGVVITLVWWPGVKRNLAVSQQAPRDWLSLAMPLAVVVMFVLFLLSVV